MMYVDIDPPDPRCTHTCTCPECTHARMHASATGGQLRYRLGDIDFNFDSFMYTLIVMTRAGSLQTAKYINISLTFGQVDRRGYLGIVEVDLQ